MGRPRTTNKIPAQSTPGPKIIHGVHFYQNTHDLVCLLWLFLYGRVLAYDPLWRPTPDIGEGWTVLHPDDKNQAYVGAGRYDAAKLLAQVVWPKGFEWSDWAERDVSAFCEYESNAQSGGAGSGKSSSAGMYALEYYHAAPAVTTVAIVSSTIEQAKKRIWKMIFALYPAIRRHLKWSVMQTSPAPRIMTLLPDGKKDEAHGIFIIPFAKGERQKAIDSLKGIHSRRVLVIGDEMDAEGMEAVYEVQDNLRSGTNEFQAIWLGNDPSLFNGLGRIMAPAPGRPVTIAHTEWNSHLGVHCIRKDGFESPNIRDNDKWTGLMRQRDIDQIVARNGGVNTPGVFVMVRGLHPPEGVEDTVLSESLLTRYHCSDWVQWQGHVTSSAMLDPAFGGDRCVIRRMDRGLDVGGKMRVLFHPPVVIPIDATDTLNPPEYQIAEKAKAFCGQHGIPPEEFILDTTGTGRGAGAVLQREWSPRINVCEFGGKPSDLPVSDEDRKPASEVYDRKVTELWYSFRQFVEADMVRGLDSKTAAEFCSRHFFIKGTGQGKKIAVEKKEEMKERGLDSPDNSDAAAMGIELLRRKGINSSIVTEVKANARQGLTTAARAWDSMENSERETYAEEFG